MFSSMPLRAGVLHLLRKVTHPRSRDAVQAGDDRDVHRLARLADQLEVLRGPDVVVLDLGKVRQRLRRSSRVPSVMKCSSAAESWRICSSKSENITTAAAPWSSSRRMRVEALRQRRRRGHERVLERQAHVTGGQVHGASPAAYGLAVSFTCGCRRGHVAAGLALAAPRRCRPPVRHARVDAPALIDVLLREPEQAPGLLRLRVGEHLVANLVVGVGLHRDRRRLRIEHELLARAAAAAGRKR